MKSSTYRSLLFLLAAAAAAAPALAAGDLALGRAGEAYRLRQAPAGELFGSAAAVPDAPALALETTLADGSTSRLAIPGTDDLRVEEKAGLLYDEASSSLLLHWQSRGADGATFSFASYGDSLSPVASLQQGASPVLFQADPQLGTSQDAFAIQLSNGQVIVAHRTTLHLAWRDSASGHALYAPVHFVEGQWVGWSEILDLTGVVRSRHQGDTPAPVAGPLASYLRLRIDEARRASAITLVDGFGGQLSEVEVRFLPMTLEQVGDRVRTRFFRIANIFKPSEDLQAATGEVGFQIIHIGMRGLGSEALTALADGLRRGLIELEGAGCGVSEPMDVYVGLAGIGKDGVLGLPNSLDGEYMHVAVIGDEPDELQALIGGVGFQIIHIGSIAAGCAPANGESQDMIQVADTGEILHIDLTGQRLTLDPANGELFAGGGTAGGGQRAALVASSAVWMRNEVSAPAAVGQAAPQVLLSPSNGDFLVAWVDGQQLRFTQTQQRFWSEPAAVALSEEMTAEMAIELLRKKLR